MAAPPAGPWLRRAAARRGAAGPAAPRSRDRQTPSFRAVEPAARPPARPGPGGRAALRRGCSAPGPVSQARRCPAARAAVGRLCPQLLARHSPDVTGKLLRCVKETFFSFIPVRIWLSTEKLQKLSPAECTEPGVGCSSRHHAGLWGWSHPRRHALGQCRFSGKMHM